MTPLYIVVVVKTKRSATQFTVARRMTIPDALCPVYRVNLRLELFDSITEAEMYASNRNATERDEL